MKNIYRNLNYIITLIFALTFSLLPSYGKINPDIFIYLLFILFIFSFIAISEERKNIFTDIKTIFTKDRIFLSLIILNILMYTSSIVASNKATTVSHSIRFSMYLFLFYLITYKFTQKQNIKILSCFLASTIIVSLISIYQTIYVYIFGNSIDIHHRISSTLENSNNLGVYSILSIFIFIMIFIKCKNIKFKVVSIISIILLLFNIIASQSRNALLALIAGFIILLFIYNRKYILYSAILPIILFIIPQTRTRIFDIFDMSQNSSRIKIWKLTEIMIKNNNELFGIGYENYSAQYSSYLQSNPSYTINSYVLIQHPHNVFLKFQVELGIFGLLAFIAFLGISIFYLYKYTVKNINSTYSYIYLGIFISFLCFQFMNIIDCYYNPIKLMYSFFLLLAICNNKVINYKKSYGY